LPALHISLGTSLKIFNLLEMHCKLLDLKLYYNDEKRDTTQDINETIQAYQQITTFEESIDSHQSTIEMIEEAMSFEISKDPENEDNIIDIFKPRIDHFINKIKSKV